jgi:AcrR family transcriptional regulator
MSAVLATPDELLGALPPKQARSVDATWQIADEGRRLFLERGYEAVSVADIAAAAGRSVGAFYTRFPTKEHLLAHLVGGLTGDLRERVMHDLNPSAIRRRGVADVIHIYFTLVADEFTRYRGIIRPATLVARQTEDEELRALLRRFNEDVHDRFRSALLERLAGDDDQAAQLRVNTMILWSSAALREVFLYQEPVSRLTRAQITFLRELTRAATLYVERVDAGHAP